MVEKRDKIKCIFFSEFHYTAGPKIAYQVPEDYLKKEDFDIIHVYIIPKPQLQNNLININALNHRIVGCPVIIDNKKYKRNALIFNLCMVFDTSVNTEKYEGIVKKLAGYLRTLEVESEFLSNEETNQRLPDLLKQLISDLNLNGACCIQINECTTLNLKVIEDCPKPSSVADHHVPMFDPSTTNLKLLHQLDLSMQQIFPYIDGFKAVAQIACEADIDIAIVKSCVQNLQYYGVIKLISVFQYSNVYTTCPEIDHLYEDCSLQQECVKYVARPGKKPHIKDVFMLYCGLTAGTTIRDLCARYNTHTLGIDERKLVQFGLLHKLIRRLHMYPVKLDSDMSVGGSHKLPLIYKWCDGEHSCDEILQKTGFSHQDLEDQIESDPSLVVCWK